MINNPTNPITINYEQQVQIFKLLTHPVRLAILDLLRDGEHCVCHLEAYLGYRQSYISQQVAVLRDAGMIQDRRDGWNIFYRITNPDIFDALDIIRSMTGQSAIIETNAVNCPCPHCKEKRQQDILRDKPFPVKLSTDF
jgi:DNA-binding transcriptional ArsR family regulator